METKAFEIRDAATFIEVLATRMLPVNSAGSEEGAAEHFLLRHSGYGYDFPLVMICRMDADGGPRQASYDPCGWGGARTLGTAQEYIQKNWGELKSGQVIDVEYILGERPTAKVSERVQHDHV